MAWGALETALAGVPAAGEGRRILILLEIEPPIVQRRGLVGHRHAPDPALSARNRGFSRVRPGLEQTFTWMKRWYGYRRVRYRGLARNALQLQLICLAQTLRRALRLRALLGSCGGAAPPPRASAHQASAPHLNQNLTSAKARAIPTSFAKLS